MTAGFGAALPAAADAEREGARLAANGHIDGHRAAAEGRREVVGRRHLRAVDGGLQHGAQIGAQALPVSLAADARAVDELEWIGQFRNVGAGTRRQRGQGREVIFLPAGATADDHPRPARSRSSGRSAGSSGRSARSSRRSACSSRRSRSSGRSARRSGRSRRSGCSRRSGVPVRPPFRALPPFRVLPPFPVRRPLLCPPRPGSFRRRRRHRQCCRLRTRWPGQ